MKKFLLLFLLFQISLTAFCQLDGDGFYFVQNYGSTRWAYLRDNYGKLDIGSQQADCGAIQMWKNKPVNDDPSAVIYIEDKGSGYYDLQGQGTGLYQLINYYVKVMDRSKYSKVQNTYWVYASTSGITKYLDDENTMSGDEGACGFNRDGNYRLWSVFKVDNSEHYLGVRPTVTINGEYYAPYYVSFAFKKAADMKVYYVSMVDASLGMAVVSEYTGDIVPASTPVLIKCQSESSSSNKIMPLVSGGTAPATNSLSGVYFNNPKRLKVTLDAAKVYDEKTIRVLGVTSKGKLGFVNSTSSLTAYKSVYYLNANQSYLPVSEGTPDELTIVSEQEYEELTAYCNVSITASANGMVVVSPESNRYKQGTVVTATATPNEGYSFESWSDGEKSNPYTFTVSKDINLLANFKVNQYTITFDSDGGSAVSSITQDFGSSVVAPSNPTKTGYTFAGWDQELPATMPAKDLTLKAKWTINQYTITFNTNGGSVVSAINANYGSDIIAPADPTREGYTFTGWDTTIPSTMPASNMTITAQWQVNQYTITFDTDGGSSVPSITQDYASDITAPESPEKTGYTFVGWDKEIPSTMPAQNMTIKATWTINQYAVIFADGERIISEKQQDYGSVIECPEDPEREGYTFCGWSPTFTVGSTVPVGGITYQAIFKVNPYKLTYEVDGNVYAVVGYSYSEAVVALPEPEKEGYTFSGWSGVPETMPAKDITVVGSFTINSYTVTFLDVDGSVIVSDKLTYGSEIASPDPQSKEGYTFTGWSPNVDDVVPAHDVTYTATYSVNTYKVSYYYNDELLYEVEVPYGSAMPEYTWQPEQDNITFNGWIGGQYETMPAHDVVYTADYTDGIRSLRNKSKLLIFTVDGKFVKSSESVKTANLPAGIYIINGKKYVVK